MSDVMIDTNSSVEGNTTEPSVDTSKVVAQPDGVLSVEPTKEDITQPEFVMPEKFAGKTAEEIAKSYIELEKMKGNTEESTEESTEETQNEPEAQETESTTEEETDSDTEEAPKGSIAEAIDKFGEVYMEKGKLDEEDYQALKETYNLDQDVVDQFIRGREAEADSHNQKIYNTLGGEEKTNTMLQWASDPNNVSKTVAEGINTLFQTDPEAGAKMLKNLYEQSVPQSGNLIKGNTSVANQGDVFKTQAEFINAMKHPEYNMGGKYDEMLNAKILRSQKQGYLI